jgi:hypothetical protein
VIHQPKIWDLIRMYLPRGTWTHIHRIYDLVEEHATLDKDDFYPQSPTSDIPKWKRNVRNVLQYRKGTREIQWNENDESYFLP